MCRAKHEGTRCSYSARIRMERANRNEEKLNSTVEAFQAKHGKKAPLPEKLERDLAIFEERKHQAIRVYRTTNAGIKDLNQEINELDKMKSKIKRSKKKGAGAQIKNIEREQKRLQDEIKRGNTLRRVMRINGKLLNQEVTDVDGNPILDEEQRPINEKSAIRQNIIYSGGLMNERAQKSLPETAAAKKDLSKVKKLALATWQRDDIKDVAKHWVEDGTNEGGWKANDNVRPAKGYKRVEPAKSKAFRMNLPDGTVGEVRNDVHIVEKDGKYFVQTRRTIAMTNLQSSPQDTTGPLLGEIIANKTGEIDRTVTVENDGASFSSPEEAKKYSRTVMNRLTQTAPVDAAIAMRESTVKWAAQGKVQHKFEQPGAHLYSPSEKKVNEKIAPKDSSKNENKEAVPA